MERTAAIVLGPRRMRLRSKQDKEAQDAKPSLEEVQPGFLLVFAKGDKVTMLFIYLLLCLLATSIGTSEIG